MVYFPQNVFKGITSYLAPLYPTRPHPVARMLESELGVWMLSLRLNTDFFTEEDVPRLFYWNRQKLLDGFFEPCYPHTALSNESSTIIEVYKQRFAGASRGWYTNRPTIFTYNNDRRLFTYAKRWVCGGFHNKVYMYEARLNPALFGDKENFDKENITNKDMIKYLKENGIKGYSKKKRKELISMCLSF